MGSVATVQRGKRLTRNQLDDTGKYPVYQNSLIPLGRFHDYNTEAQTSFIISAGAAGEIGFSYEKFWKADDVWTCDTEVILQRYLYYVLMSNQNRIASQVRRASIPRLSKNTIENLVFPIPPFDKQSEIVSILDKFDTLTSSLSQGLPKEIELRQKQYEYHRERLLDFK